MDLPNGNSTEIAVMNPKLAEIRVSDSSNTQSEGIMRSSPAKEPLMKRLIRWICPDQRVANRHTLPPLTVWLGMVRSSKEYKVGDVSVAGFYMMTEERWIPGTSFPVTLERTDEAGMGRILTVQATVVRCTDDGVGFSFIHNAAEENADSPAGANNRVDLTKLAQFLKGLPLTGTTSDQLERVS
jgi:hypothetical protein